MSPMTNRGPNNNKIGLAAIFPRSAPVNALRVCSEKDIYLAFVAGSIYQPDTQVSFLSRVGLSVLEPIQY